MYKVADVIVPLAAPKAYTYLIPEGLSSEVQTGQLVEIQFGKRKLYSGIVQNIRSENSIDRLKPILSVLDDTPAVYGHNIDFWRWIADYYICTPGEVMVAALPAALKMSSETVVIKTDHYKEDEYPDQISDDAFLIAEALNIQQSIKLSDIAKIIDKSSVLPHIKELLDTDYAYLEEEVKSMYKPKTQVFIRLGTDFRDETNIDQLFEACARSEKQTRLLLSYFQLKPVMEHIPRTDVVKHSETDTATVNALVKKGIIDLYDRNISRISEDDLFQPELPPLSDFQQRALEEIKLGFEADKVCLLRGITGSGKTRIYQELINPILKSGGQVLYLLPEISLTSQMEYRLKQQYGPSLYVYHSKLNNQKRAEIWKKIYHGHNLVVGARSSLLLPFKNLKLIIVDEEHDPSYKQQDPAPRYHCRDAAIYLAQHLNANIILGSATPSIESMHSAQKGKYQYVEMLERYGKSVLPEMILVDMVKAKKQLKTASLFSMVLLEAIEHTLNQKERVILFQNRRGFSPVLECDVCAYTSMCIHCDVSLTMHKYERQLRCHYCGYRTDIPTTCPDCGSPSLSLKGFGTEKIEEEIKAFFPEIKIDRLDTDTTRSKGKMTQLLDDFEYGDIEILVGTQMITKGLDFSRVGLVGVLNADQSLHYPDFRSAERTFQLITQVSGRSGRREKPGKVIIQSSQIGHPVINEIKNHDYLSHYQREIKERLEFKYPPYIKLIKVIIKHKDLNLTNKAANILATGLKGHFGDRILGPTPGSIPRINNQYIFNILIKCERNLETINQIKQTLQKGYQYVSKQKGMSNIRIIFDIDPV